MNEDIKEKIRKNAHRLVEKLTTDFNKIQSIEIEGKDAKLRHITFVMFVNRCKNASGETTRHIPLNFQDSGFSWRVKMDKIKDDNGKEVDYSFYHSNFAKLHFFEDADGRCYLEDHESLFGDGWGNIDTRCNLGPSVVHAKISKKDFAALRAVYELAAMSREEKSLISLNKQLESYLA